MESSQGMTGQQRRESLRRRLDGHWEYVCRVTSPEPFEENVMGRGGIMTIRVRLPWTGVTARIVAERLWKTTSRDDTPDDREPLLHPIQWNADGAVIFDDGRLSFEYLSGDGRGVTKDTFQLLEDSDTLYIGLGTFEHQRIDGRHVKGTVQLRKMRHYEDFIWAPDGVNPVGIVVQPPGGIHDSQPRPNGRHGEPGERHIALTFDSAGLVLIGDVKGGEVTGTMKEMPFAPGDSNSLTKVLDQIEVPSEDINQIREIVRSEEPKEGAIGSRAAAWVGSMVTKSLTGDWEVGKGVSSTALKEIILRFYGLK